jgi:hypothetical protein
MYKYVIYFLSIIVLFSCTKPFDAGIIQSNSRTLVVEGMVNDGPGPYIIKLTETVPYNADSISYIGGSSVYVEDNLGNIFGFKEKSKGLYYSDSLNFTGQPGRIYTLHVKNKDGFEYKSVPCKIPDKIGIDSIYSNMENHLISTKPDEYGNYFYETVLQIYTNIRFNQAKNARLDAFVVDTLRIRHLHFAPYSYMDTIIGKMVTSTYLDFEIDHYSFSINKINQMPVILSNTNYLSGGTSKNINMSFIEQLQKDSIYSNDTTNYIYSQPYMAFINAYSISDITFNYYYNLSKQLNGSSNSLFEPIPIQLKGNLTCITDSSKLVLGLFEANAVTTKRYSVFNGPTIFPRVFDTTIMYPSPQDMVTVIQRKSNYRLH